MMVSCKIILSRTNSIYPSCPLSFSHPPFHSFLFISLYVSVGCVCVWMLNEVYAVVCVVFFSVCVMLFVCDFSSGSVCLSASLTHSLHMSDVYPCSKTHIILLMRPSFWKSHYSPRAHKCSGAFSPSSFYFRIALKGRLVRDDIPAVSVSACAGLVSVYNARLDRMSPLNPADKCLVWFLCVSD